MFLCAAVITLSACGDTTDLPPANNRTVTSVECNDGTLIYVYQEDCASVTCEGHGGVKSGCY